MQHFATSVNVDGETITPKGYVWVLGFALAGCEWAIKKASTPEFLSMVRADLKKEQIEALERAIQHHESEIVMLTDNIEELM